MRSTTALWTAVAWAASVASACASVSVGAQPPTPAPTPAPVPPASAPPTGAPATAPGVPPSVTPGVTPGSVVAPTGRPIAAVDEPSVVVRRLAGDSVVLGSAALAALFRYDVRATVAGRPAAFAGVSLQDVLRAAGVPLDSLGASHMADVVLVEGADGYRVAFTLAELAPTLGRRTALVADQRDGQPLGFADGPLRLVVPDDARQSRWVRRLRALTVRSAVPPPPATP